MNDAPAGNFIRAFVQQDLASGRLEGRRWSGAPGPAADHESATLDPARIRTRFPPEPNGYLHIGHAKSICLNFGLAADFGGRCHLRFDDTNPTREEQAFVDAIIDTVSWLGFQWADDQESNLYFASNYFEHLYRFAETLIVAGHAYVDSQSPDEMREHRGTLTEPGRDSPFRDRDADENLRLFRAMRAGEFDDGAHVLRARIDMASPNINLRDPVLYRIRRAHHHRTGDSWCIYPMYDFAHPVGDALERVTHSLCTLEFEDHRPFYDWLLARLAEAGAFDAPLPRQIEFARLNLSYTVMSKRKLQELVRHRHVDGWDDPRLPTLAGLRRRGYTPAAIRDFCERIGVTKSDAWIDMGVLEQALRDDLEDRADRAIAVLDPLRLSITNWPADRIEACHAPVHPRMPDRGRRTIAFDGELWIEREDFVETPPKGFFRLYPGNRVRLRYGFVIECTGCEKDANGRVTRVLAEVLPDSKSGTPGADNYKVKGNLHWLSISKALPAEFRLYDRLFVEAQPDAGGRDYLTTLNPDARRFVSGFVEEGLADGDPHTPYQFERHGYFVGDDGDSRPGALVFNRAVTLKDSWAKRR
ncbi:MAG: glutamine--tRNA ligase/YqeY domain fusion protein [Burkholderiaceae bacterium]|nr:glutamine--tRNA ligase/YqeY domain fusion protein [Burkholderiaceae bacterium]